jgi:hypothetical protein
MILGPQIASSESKIFIVWENKTRGDLYLTTMQAQMPPTDYSVHSQSRIVNIQIDSQPILPNQTLPISLSFYELDGTLAQNVNYTIITKDVEGNVLEQKNHFSESGLSDASAILPQEGTYQIAVRVLGSDLQQYEDETILVSVVPEFSNGIILLAIMILFLTLLYRFVPSKRLTGASTFDNRQQIHS